MTQTTSQQFTSWKEIAAYLGKGVRTVQRWEIQFGLPVQRPNAKSKGIVRASREDLDHWISNRWSVRSAGTESKTPMPPNRVPVRSGLKYSRDLQESNRRLLEQVVASVSALSIRCRQLARVYGGLCDPSIAGADSVTNNHGASWPTALQVSQDVALSPGAHLIVTAPDSRYDSKERGCPQIEPGS